VLKDPMKFVGVETSNIQFWFQYQEDAAFFDERYRAVAGAGQAVRDAGKDKAESAAEGKGIEGERVAVQSHHDLPCLLSMSLHLLSMSYVRCTSSGGGSPLLISMSLCRCT